MTLEQLAAENHRLKAEIERRVAEWSIIEGIQQGIAAGMDFQAIVDLAGDQLRRIFDGADIAIQWYDDGANLLHVLYAYELGERISIEPRAPVPGGSFEKMIVSRQAIVVNSAKVMAAAGYSDPTDGTRAERSLVDVPIVANNCVRGTIRLADFEHERAFGDSEVGLLTSVAAGISIALQNARQIDETQRLFKESEQRLRCSLVAAEE